MTRNEWLSSRLTECCTTSAWTVCSPLVFTVAVARPDFRDFTQDDLEVFRVVDGDSGWTRAKVASHSQSGFQNLATTTCRHSIALQVEFLDWDLMTISLQIPSSRTPILMPMESPNLRPMALQIVRPISESDKQTYLQGLHNNLETNCSASSSVSDVRKRYNFWPKTYLPQICEADMKRYWCSVDQAVRDKFLSIPFEVITLKLSDLSRLKGGNEVAINSKLWFRAQPRLIGLGTELLVAEEDLAKVLKAGYHAGDAGRLRALRNDPLYRNDPEGFETDLEITLRRSPGAIADWYQQTLDSRLEDSRPHYATEELWILSRRQKFFEQFQKHAILTVRKMVGAGADEREYIVDTMLQQFVKEQATIKSMLQIHATSLEDRRQVLRDGASSSTFWNVLPSEPPAQPGQHVGETANQTKKKRRDTTPAMFTHIGWGEQDANVSWLHFMRMIEPYSPVSGGGVVSRKEEELFREKTTTRFGMQKNIPTENSSVGMQKSLQYKLSMLQDRADMFDNLVQGLEKYRACSSTELPEEIAPIHVYQAAYSCALHSVEAQLSSANGTKKLVDEKNALEEKGAKIREKMESRAKAAKAEQLVAQGRVLDAVLWSLVQQLEDNDRAAIDTLDTLSHRIRLMFHALDEDGDGTISKEVHAIQHSIEC